MSFETRDSLSNCPHCDAPPDERETRAFDIRWRDGRGVYCAKCNTFIGVLGEERQGTLERVLKEAEGVFKDLKEWMDTVNKHLDDKTPLQLIEEGRENEVLSLIKALKDGVMF